jgi:hypothetical protein
VNAQVGPQWRLAQTIKIRAAMGQEMCAVADALRAEFGAKLEWLRTETLEHGREPDWGVPTQWYGRRRP